MPAPPRAAGATAAAPPPFTAAIGCCAGPGAAAGAGGRRRRAAGHRRDVIAYGALDGLRAVRIHQRDAARAAHQVADLVGLARRTHSKWFAVGALQHANDQGSQQRMLLMVYGQIELGAQDVQA